MWARSLGWSTLSHSCKVQPLMSSMSWPRDARWMAGKPLSEVGVYFASFTVATLDGVETRHQFSSLTWR